MYRRSAPPSNLAIVKMVLCVVLGCSKRSGRDKDVSFFRIPKVKTNRGIDMEILSRKRRSVYLQNDVRLHARTHA